MKPGKSSFTAKRRAGRYLREKRKLWHAPLNKREQVVFTRRAASY